MDHQVLDRVAELMGRYAQAIDSGDIEQWADVFHEQASWVGPQRRPRRGRADIVDFLNATGVRSEFVHVTLNTEVVEVDGAQVKTRSDFVLLEKQHDRSHRVEMVCEYRDVLVQDGDRLRILHREATLAQPARVVVKRNSLVIAPCW